MTKLPALWRRTNADGADFGSYYVTVKKRRINLQTDDRQLAHERRREAVRGARKWPRKMLPKVSAPTPAGGTAAENLAALGEVDALPLNPGSEGSPAPLNGHSPAAAPALGALPAVPVIEPEPIPPPPPEAAGEWAADLGAAKADAPADEPPPAATRIRLADMAWLDGALVTASKAAVGLQLFCQAWTMKLLGDVEAGHVGPAPTMREPSNPDEAAAFMKKAGTRWEEGDPREPGRQLYEQTIKALLPEDLPIPDWAWAPIVTAIYTVPVQLKGATKIKRDADGKEVPRDEQPAAEAPGDARAAA